MAYRSALSRDEKTRLRISGQMAIDAKQQEIDKLRYVADRKGQFTDEFAPALAQNLRDEVL